MKKIGLLFLISFSMTCVGQNWILINKFERYNFALGNDSTNTTIFVDSTNIGTTDSTYYFNRIIKNIVTNYPASFYGDFYLNNSPQFLLAEMYFQSNSMVTLQKDSTKYFFKPYANIGDNWIFDSTLNITAQIIDAYETNIFGNLDSVKIIELSSNDTIILSKNFGIIKFPCFNNPIAPYTLVGVEGRNLGKLIPKYFDFYNFNIGDVFKYWKNDAGHFNNYTNSIITITDKIILGNSIKYYTTRQEYYSNNYGNPPSSAIFTDTLEFVDSPNDLLNKYNNQILNYPFCASMYKPVSVGFNNTFQCIQKSYPSDHISQWAGDTIFTPQYPLCSNEYTSETFGEHVGLIRYYHQTDNNGSPYSYYTDKQLRGCIINGVVYGEDPLIGINEIDYKAVKTLIYPNPTENILNILIKGDVATNYTIQIKDITGRVIKNLITSSNKVSLNIKNYTSGCYFVTITDLNNVVISNENFIKY